MTRYLLAALLCLLPALATAQTVTCDAAPLITETVDYNVGKVLVGWSEKLADGTPATATGWAMSDAFNGAPATVSTLVMTRVTTTPNAQGLLCYTAPVTLANGTHVLAVRVFVGPLVAIGNSMTVLVSAPVATPVFPTPPHFLTITK